MQRLIFDHGYALPTERVFEYLSEHENLADLFGAKVTRLKNGTDGNRNGIGSVRELKVGPTPPFEETVTEFVPNELIAYEITKGSPLKSHHGEMRFTREGEGTHLHYEISFASKIPGVDFIIAQGLKRNIAKGLTARGDGRLTVRAWSAKRSMLTSSRDREGKAGGWTAGGRGSARPAPQPARR